MHFWPFWEFLFSYCMIYKKTNAVLYGQGGVAQCLRRRSLAGELSLMPDLWSTDDHFVDKVSLWVNQPVELSLPSLWDQFNE